MGKVKNKYSGLGIASFVAIVLLSYVPIVGSVIMFAGIILAIVGLFKFEQLKTVDKTFLVLSWMVILVVLFVVINPPFCCG